MEETKRSTVHSLVHVEPHDVDNLSIADLLTTRFDYIIRSDMYKPHKNTLAVYDLMRQIMASQNRMKQPIVTLSSDPAISGSTIAGVAEKYMYTVGGEKPTVQSDLKVIYIDAYPDISLKKYTHYSDFSNSVLSDVIGTAEHSYTMHRVNVSPENIYLIGINQDNLSELADEQKDIIGRTNLFTLQTLQKKGIRKIMNHVVDDCQLENVHITIDLSSVQSKYAPSVHREDGDGKDGFDCDQLIDIVKILKKLKKINSVDITGYYFGNKKDKTKHNASNMLTVRLITDILKHFIDLKQKSINIFNENSKFLIWRRFDETDPIGWRILRGSDLQEREQLIQSIGDQIITVSIPDEDPSESDSKKQGSDNQESDNQESEEPVQSYFDAMVTVTTIAEQQEKSYYCAKSFQDCCLYPGEKVSMIFELINTPNVQQSNEFTEPKQIETNTGSIMLHNIINNPTDPTHQTHPTDPTHQTHPTEPTHPTDPTDDQDDSDVETGREKEIDLEIDTCIKKLKTD
jgi:arginase family enzyme